MALALGALDKLEFHCEAQWPTIVAAVLLLAYDTLLSCGAAALLLILLAQREGALHRMLLAPALVFLGRISFSLYLVHLPILLALNHALHDVLPREAIDLVMVPLSVPAAYVFYQLIELPAQGLSRRLGEVRLLVGIRQSDAKF